MKVGDVITDFSGKPIAMGTQLQWLASTAGVGKTVDVTVQRQGKPESHKVTLGLLETSPPRRLP